MSDLIDRQKALDGLKYEMKYGAVIDQCGLDTAYDIIKDLPSAEPERKKGKWVDSGWKIIYRCSECGNYLDFSGLNAGRGDANFCPNCGAEMTRGE